MEDKTEALTYDPNYLGHDLQPEPNGLFSPATFAKYLALETMKVMGEGQPASTIVKQEPGCSDDSGISGVSADFQDNDSGASRMPARPQGKTSPVQESVQLPPVVQLARYGGIPLLLARKNAGIQLNCHKKGKKPKRWFMDVSQMSESDAERHREYLRKKDLGLLPQGRRTKKPGQKVRKGEKATAPPVLSRKSAKVTKRKRKCHRANLSEEEDDSDEEEAYRLAQQLMLELHRQEANGGTRAKPGRPSSRPRKTAVHSKHLSHAAVDPPSKATHVKRSLSKKGRMGQGPGHSDAGGCSPSHSTFPLFAGSKAAHRRQNKQAALKKPQILQKKSQSFISKPAGGSRLKKQRKHLSPSQNTVGQKRKKKGLPVNGEQQALARLTCPFPSSYRTDRAALNSQCWQEAVHADAVTGCFVSVSSEDFGKYTGTRGHENKACSDCVTKEFPSVGQQEREQEAAPTNNRDVCQSALSDPCSNVAVFSAVEDCLSEMVTVVCGDSPDSSVDVHTSGFPSVEDLGGECVRLSTVECLPSSAEGVGEEQQEGHHLSHPMRSTADTNSGETVAPDSVGQTVEETHSAVQFSLMQDNHSETLPSSQNTDRDGPQTDCLPLSHAGNTNSRTAVNIISHFEQECQGGMAAESSSGAGVCLTKCLHVLVTDVCSNTLPLNYLSSLGVCKVNLDVHSLSSQPSGKCVKRKSGSKLKEVAKKTAQFSMSKAGKSKVPLKIGKSQMPLRPGKPKIPLRTGKLKKPLTMEKVSMSKAQVPSERKGAKKNKTNGAAAEGRVCKPLIQQASSGTTGHMTAVPGIGGMLLATATATRIGKSPRKSQTSGSSGGTRKSKAAQRQCLKALKGKQEKSHAKTLTVSPVKLKTSKVSASKKRLLSGDSVKPKKGRGNSGSWNSKGKQKNAKGLGGGTERAEMVLEPVQGVDVCPDENFSIKAVKGVDMSPDENFSIKLERIDPVLDGVIYREATAGQGNIALADVLTNMPYISVRDIGAPHRPPVGSCGSTAPPNSKDPGSSGEHFIKLCQSPAEGDVQKPVYKTETVSTGVSSGPNHPTSEAQLSGGTPLHEKGLPHCLFDALEVFRGEGESVQDMKSQLTRQGTVSESAFPEQSQACRVTESVNVIGLGDSDLCNSDGASVCTGPLVDLSGVQLYNGDGATTELEFDRPASEGQGTLVTKTVSDVWHTAMLGENDGASFASLKSSVKGLGQREETAATPMSVLPNLSSAVGETEIYSLAVNNVAEQSNSKAVSEMTSPDTDRCVESPAGPNPSSTPTIAGPAPAEKERIQGKNKHILTSSVEHSGTSKEGGAAVPHKTKKKPGRPPKKKTQQQEKIPEPSAEVDANYITTTSSTDSQVRARKTKRKTKTTDKGKVRKKSNRRQDVSVGGKTSAVTAGEVGSRAQAMGWARIQQIHAALLNTKSKSTVKQTALSALANAIVKKSKNSARNIDWPPKKRRNLSVSASQPAVKKRKKFLYVETDLGDSPEPQVKKRGRPPGPKIVLDRSQVNLCFEPEDLPDTSSSDMIGTGGQEVSSLWLAQVGGLNPAVFEGAVAVVAGQTVAQVTNTMLLQDPVLSGCDASTDQGDVGVLSQSGEMYLLDTSTALTTVYAASHGVYPDGADCKPDPADLEQSFPPDVKPQVSQLTLMSDTNTLHVSGAACAGSAPDTGLPLQPSELSAQQQSELSALQPSELPALQQSELPALQPSELPVLQSSELSALQQSEFSALQSSELSALQSSELSALQQSELSALQSSELSALQQSELSALQQSELSALQQSELSAQQQSELSALQQSELSTQQQSELSALQQSELSALQSSELSAPQQSELFPLQSELSAQQPSELFAQQQSELSALQQSELSALQQSELSALQQSELSPLKPSELPLLQPLSDQHSDAREALLAVLTSHLKASDSSAADPPAVDQSPAASQCSSAGYDLNRHLRIRRKKLKDHTFYVKADIKKACKAEDSGRRRSDRPRKPRLTEVQLRMAQGSFDLDLELGDDGIPSGLEPSHDTPGGEDSAGSDIEFVSADYSSVDLSSQRLSLEDLVDETSPLDTAAKLEGREAVVEISAAPEGQGGGETSGDQIPFKDGGRMGEDTSHLYSTGHSNQGHSQLMGESGERLLSDTHTCTETKTETVTNISSNPVSGDYHSVAVKTEETSLENQCSCFSHSSPYDNHSMGAQPVIKQEKIKEESAPLEVRDPLVGPPSDLNTFQVTAPSSEEMPAATDDAGDRYSGGDPQSLTVGRQSEPQGTPTHKVNVPLGLPVEGSPSLTISVRTSDGQQVMLEDNPLDPAEGDWLQNV